MREHSLGFDELDLHLPEALHHVTRYVFDHNTVPSVTDQTGLPSGNAVQKADDEPELRHTNIRSASHPDPESISVTILDSEGSQRYSEKCYRIGVKLNIKKVLNQIRSHVCAVWSKPQMLEFWFETAMLKSGQTAALLGLQNGDTIDIRLKEACTRDAHPLSAPHTSPNMHYLDTGVYTVVAEDLQPPARKPTIHLTFRNDTSFLTTFRLCVDKPILKACEAFEVLFGISVGHGRFHCEGTRVDGRKTPLELKLEDGDFIDCYSELFGGSRPREMTENFSHRLEPRLSPTAIVEQIILIFADGYQHRFPVAVASDSQLQQAFRYVALRMGKNPGNVSFEIAGQRFDFEGLGTKSPGDLSIGTDTVVEVRYAPPKPGQSKSPDDSLLPRSVRHGTRPLERPNGVRRV